MWNLASSRIRLTRKKAFLSLLSAGSSTMCSSYSDVCQFNYRSHRLHITSLQPAHVNIRLNRFSLTTSSYLGRKRYIPLCFTELPPSPGYKLMKFSEESRKQVHTSGFRAAWQTVRLPACSHLPALLQQPASQLYLLLPINSFKTISVLWGKARSN